MDNLTFQDFSLLFGLILPASVASSIICFMSAGLFREWWEQPRIFRLISRGDYQGRNPTLIFIVLAVIFASANVIPVLVLLPGPRSQMGLAGAYFAVLALWFAYVAFAALRARSRRRVLPSADFDHQPPVSAEETRSRALIDQLDFEDAVESGTYWRRGRAGGQAKEAADARGGGDAAQSTADTGEPCTIYPVEWQGAQVLPTKFDVAGAADSYQGALILELARSVDPRFPAAGTSAPILVVRSRILRAYPGNRLARYGSLTLSLLFGVGAAVFEVESQMTANGVVLAFVRAEGKRRWGFGFGGDSQELLADAARLAGEQVGRELLAALAAHGPEAGFHYPASTVARVPVFAGLGVRLASLLIDGAFLFASLIVAVVLMDQVGYRQVGNAMVYSSAAMLVQWVWFSFLVAYYPVCWWRFQGTVGQLLLGLRVVRAADESSLGVGTTTIRYLVFTICVLAVLPALVSAGVASFDPRKQTWWDKVGDSVVVCET